MSTTETTAVGPVVVLDATGGASITVGDDTTSLTAADVETARRQAQRVMVDQATRTGAPVTFVAVDALGRRQLVAYPDGRVRPVRTQTPTRAAAAPSAEGPAGRGRVSRLPAADELQVPDRVDTGTAVRGTPLGSPADAPVTARPVSTQPSNAAPHDQAGTPRTPRRRRRRAVAAIAIVTLVGAGGAGGVWWRQDVLAREQAAAAAAADDAAAARALAAANAEAERVAEQARAEKRDQAQALIQEASQVLGESTARVADDAVRASLEAAIADLASSLETGDPTTWSLLSAKVLAAVDVVRAAQAQWESDEAARVAAEQEAANAAAAAAAQAAARSSSKASTPTTQAPAAAAPPATSTDTGSGVRSISASLSSGRGSASISVLVTTKGPTSVSVTATIAGQSVPLSGPASVDGSATFTGSLSGLPAGTQTWTATAGGLSTSGSIEVF